MPASVPRGLAPAPARPALARTVWLPPRPSSLRPPHRRPALSLVLTHRDRAVARMAGAGTAAATGAGTTRGATAATSAGTAVSRPRRAAGRMPRTVRTLPAVAAATTRKTARAGGVAAIGSATATAAAVTVRAASRR